MQWHQAQSGPLEGETRPWLSVIVPARDEAAGIAAVLEPLQPWRRRGVEVLLVDGESTDRTAELARPRVDQVLRVAPGRARQMNAGAMHARAPRLWFLHADTLVRDQHLEYLASTGAAWGHFRVRLSGGHPLFRVIECLMNLRSRWTGIATGDQSLFLNMDLFRAVGCFPEQPLMEDIELARRLRARAGWPVQAGPPVSTDSRRWEHRGPWRTMVQMWRLRWRYWRGDDPACLGRLYERGGQ